ncbi:class I SAM-dependent RNA methyltransferase [Acidocella sp.]|uniref:class I SAM-dependent RNA methyltransferase n=1 Tax=Acidocella sp. TaxID=50710 RepID=UPI0026306B7D|nr:class I SAM-dependent RNA methyltransferase [Acidocella sp.]
MSHCIHFGICGGCAHTTGQTPNKSARLQAALARAGYAAPSLAPLIAVPPASRRRVDLGAERIGPALHLGLHKPRGREVVDMAECALLRPELLALLAPLRVVLRSLQALKRTAAVHINWLDTGADLLIRTDAPFQQPDRARLIAFAKTHDLPRISIASGSDLPEPLAVLRPPVIQFGGVPVTPPPGGFLQASAEGEAAIVAAVLAALPKLTQKSRLIELYCGSGTLTFPLAPHARLEAFEGAEPAVYAAQQAANARALTGRLTITKRDLARRPLQASELNGAAAIILDPPFTGAGPQIRFIIKSDVKRLIYISCNPDALSTDAAQLHHAGFALLHATPIDQFLYSDNLESVVVFER